MKIYNPPIKEFRFLLEAIGYGDLSALEKYAAYDIQTVIELLTEAGKFWYRQVKGGSVPRVGYDINAEIQRRHKTDFITMRNGSRADLRTWHPEKNAFVYTKLGKEFFEQRPRQYITSIPSRIKIKRRDGKTYEMFGHYPATDL